MPIDPALRRLIASFRKSPNWDSDLDLEVLQKLWPTLVGNVPDLIWRKQLVKMRPQLLEKMNEPWATPWIKEIAFTYEN
jgi:hypothetical protein